MPAKEFLRHRKHFLAHIPAKVLRQLPKRDNPERLRDMSAPIPLLNDP